MNDPGKTLIAKAIAIFERNDGVMRTSALLHAGVHPRTLYWMRDCGLVEALSRGVYHLTSHQLPARPDTDVVIRRVPGGILCLVSALDLHQVGTQIPTEVQIALPQDTKAPRIDFPRVRVFRMSAASLEAGVESRDIGGTTLRVFGVAKTVADCFKFRNRIGLDVALEALQEVIREKRATPTEIMQYAKVDRVANIVRPYIQALS
jgi:predicted transcriptional regulator of viral defense system